MEAAERSTASQLDWNAVFASVGITNQNEIDDQVVSAFVTGSRAWGTAEEKVSDWDLILVVKDSAPSAASLIESDAGFALLERFIPDGDSSKPIECNVELMRESWFWNELILDKANLQAISCLYLPDHLIYKQSHPEWRQMFENSLQPWRILRALLWKAPSSFNRGRFYFRHAQVLLDNHQEHMGTDESVPVEIRGWSASLLIRRGKKMISHTFRYILFAYQLLQERKLTNLSAGREYWFELKADPSTSWQHFEDKYRPQYKSLLDSLPMKPEDKLAPADAVQQSTPEKYHRLLFLFRQPKQQNSYESGIQVELLELARHAGKLPLQSLLSSLNPLEDSFLFYDFICVPSMSHALLMMQEGAIDDQVNQEISLHFPLLVTQWELACSQLQQLWTQLDEEYALAMKDCLQRLGPDFDLSTDEPKLRRALNEYIKLLPTERAMFGRAMVAMQKNRQSANGYLGTCSPKEFGIVYAAIAENE